MNLDKKQKQTNEILRARKKILEENIKKWNLNLKNLTVLTEAASGNYIYTPLIAAMAGAKVYALTKDSPYGKASKIKIDTLLLAEKFGVSKKIEVFEQKLPSSIISKSDIVTNLGFLRPLNQKFISYLKKTAVIPLMWETWEFRENDLDLKTCWERDISVLGTNENHFKLRILDYLGDLILKKIAEEGIKKITNLRTVVLGDNRFTFLIKKTLRNSGARVYNSVKYLKGAKILIIAFHKEKKVIIGKKGILIADKLKELAPDVLVIQLSGSGIIFRQDLARVKISFIPKKTPKPHFMSWTLAEVGPKPVIKLHTAGLKVGEILAKARLKGLSREEAEIKALKESPAQDFSKKQKEKYGFK